MTTDLRRLKRHIHNMERRDNVRLLGMRRSFNQKVKTLRGGGFFSRLFSSSTTVNYPNGDVYVGHVKDGKPHGKGTMTFFQNRERRAYKGEWQNGQMHGKGIMMYRCVGDDFAQHFTFDPFSFDLIHFGDKPEVSNYADYDPSLITKEDSETMDKIYGKNVFQDTYLTEGPIFTNIYFMDYGEDEKTVEHITWKKNEKGETGIDPMEYKKIYTGEWKEGKRHGEGNLVWVQADWTGSYEVQYYTGGWENDVRHGQGFETSILGVRDYKNGEWKDGTFNQKPTN